MTTLIVRFRYRGRLEGQEVLMALPVPAEYALDPEYVDA